MGRPLAEQERGWGRPGLQGPEQEWVRDNTEREGSLEAVGLPTGWEQESPGHSGQGHRPQTAWSREKTSF